MKVRLIVPLALFFAKSITASPIPDILTAAGLTIPDLTGTATIKNDSTFDQTYTLIPTGGITPNGTHATLVFNAEIRSAPDIHINGPFEETGGTSWFQVDGSPTPYVDIIFGQPFTVRLQAFSEVWYYYNPGSTMGPQMAGGHTITPDDTGSSVRILGIVANLDNGGGEDMVSLEPVGDSVTAAAVPEPGSVLLIGSAMVLLGALRTRR